MSVRWLIRQQDGTSRAGDAASGAVIVLAPGERIELPAGAALQPGQPGPGDLALVFPAPDDVRIVLGGFLDLIAGQNVVLQLGPLELDTLAAVLQAAATGAGGGTGGDPPLSGSGLSIGDYQTTSFVASFDPPNLVDPDQAGGPGPNGRSFVGDGPADDGTPPTTNTPPGTPTVSVTQASGVEDSVIALSIQAGVDGASDGLSVLISGVPAGAALSAGADLGGGLWQLTASDLIGLTLTLPPNDDSSFSLTVTVASTFGGVQRTTTDTLSVAVLPVIDRLFTPGDDVVDLSAIPDATQASGTMPWAEDRNLSDALAGDDVVTLASSGPNALAAGTTFFGGEGNDRIAGGALDDVIAGGAGDDVIAGGDGSDRLDGGTGENWISYAATSGPVATSLASGTATKTTGLEMLANFRHVIGSAFADQLVGDANANSLLGGGGDDTFLAGAGPAGAGNDFLDGGSGRNWASYAALGAGVAVDLAAGSAVKPSGVDTLVNVQHVVGTGASDTLAGDAADNTLEGGDGADTLTGGGGNDVLVAAADAGDMLVFQGAVAQYGYAANGNDLAIADSVAGRDGTDIAQGVGATPSLHAARFADGDFAIASYGTGAATVVSGLAGNMLAVGSFLGDTFQLTGGGIHLIAAGGGNDTLQSGAGVDYLLGEAGDDMILLAAGDFAAGETVDGGGGADTLALLGGSNDLSAGGLRGIEALAFGAAGATAILAGAQIGGAGIAANAAVAGGAGVDTLIFNLAAGGVLDLSGFAFSTWTDGTDSIRLVGAGGAEKLTGTSQADTLQGFAGNDTLAGGAGADRVLFQGDVADYGYALDAGGSLVVTDQVVARDDADTLDGIEEAGFAGNPFGLVYGSNGDDILSGTAGRDLVLGFDGADTMDGGAGADALIGGGGNDVFLITVASDFAAGEVIRGDGGTDVVLFAGAAAGSTLVLTNLVTGVEQATIGDLAGSTIVTNGTTALNLNAAALGFGVTLTGNDGANAIDGTDFADTIDGNGGADSVLGGGGDDVLLFANAAEMAGDATVDGGAGADTVLFSGAAVTLADADLALASGIEAIHLASTGVHMLTLAGNANAAFVDGVTVSVVNTATRLIVAGAGLGVQLSVAGVDAGAGNDTLAGGSAADTLLGLNGNDIFIVGDGLFAASETIDGGAGSDALATAGTNDYSVGGVLGIERLIFDAAGATASFAGSQVGAGGLASNAVIFGGAGADNLRFNVALGGMISLNGFSFSGWSSAVDSIRLEGAAGSETLTGTFLNDTFVAGAGADTIDGGGGNDVFIVNDGEFAAGETIDGGSGTNTLIVAGTNDFSTGAVVNIRALTFDATGATASFAGAQVGAALLHTNTTVTGGAGIDTLIFNVASGGSALLSGLGFAAGTWTNGTDSIRINGSTGTEVLQGTSQADTITGGDGNDRLDGFGGNDTLIAGSGVNSVFGGNDDDLLIVGDGEYAGAGFLTGDAGTDTLRLSGANNFNGAIVTTIEHIEFAAGGAATFGGSQLTNISATPTVTGSAGIDVLIAEVAGASAVSLLNFTFAGWTDGTDSIRLNGSAGNQLLVGSDQSDTIAGGAGADNMQGRGGDDLLVFANGDVASGESIDGGAGSDTLLVTGANDFRLALAVAGIEALTFAGGGTASFSNGQFTSASPLPADLSVTGSSGADVLQLTNQSALGHDFSALQFASWTDGVDSVRITSNAGASVIGTTQADTFTGSNAADTSFGRAGDDTINGGTGNDTLSGEAGNDSLAGGFGNDTLDGGADFDRAVFQGSLAQYSFSFDGGGNLVVTDLVANRDGVDTLIGIEELFFTSGGTTVTLPITFGTSGPDIFNGGSGDDVYDGLGGNDTVTGGGGNDILSGDTGADTLTGGEGNDQLVFGNSQSEGDIAVFSGPITEYLIAASGGNAVVTDLVAGRDGTDTIIGSFGSIGSSSFLQFAGMNFALSVQGFNGGGVGAVNVVALGSDSVTSYSFTGSGIHYIDGAGGNDFLFGGSGIDYLFGGSGNDSLSGNAGVDTISGGAGDDSITGGAGNDTIDGGDGNDTFLYNTVSDGMDLLLNFDGDAAGGQDFLKLDLLFDALGVTGASRAARVQVTDSDGGAFGPAWLVQVDTDGNGQFTDPGDLDIATIVSSDEITVAGDIQLGTEALTLTGTGGNDTITGSLLDDTIDGISGNDTIYGLDGNDTLTGNTGDDQLTGGGGNDTLIGGLQSDTVFFAGDFNEYSFVATGTTFQVVDSIEVRDGTDTLSGVEVMVFADQTIDMLIGDAASNALVDNGLVDTFHGLAGNDTLTGDGNADVMFGGAAFDTLNGNAGDDTLSGGQDQDTIDGGADSDTVVFTGTVGEYYFTTSAGFIVVTDSVAGRDGTDFIANAELLSFDGSTLAVQTGDGNANVLSGGATNELLVGFGGADTVTGGGGNDVIVLGSGESDVAVYAGAIAEYDLTGIAGTLPSNGALVVADQTVGRDDTDRISGGVNNDGTNLVRFAGVDFAVNVLSGAVTSFSSAAAANYIVIGHSTSATSGGLSLTGSGIHYIRGGGGNDVITGGSNIDYLFGGAGNDSLTGNDGADTLTGGGGNDILNGGNGGDVAAFSGDRADYGFTDAGTQLRISDAVGGRDGTDTLAEIELLRFADQTVSIVIGTSADESLAGTNAADVVFGLNGNDTINGFVGADQLFGGAGSDVFHYGGADFQLGETVDGGSGTDTLVFTGGGGGGINDFSTGSVLDIEALVFEAPISVVSTFRSDQLSATTAVTGGSLAGLESHTLVVNAVSGGTADLSGFTFSSWGAGHNVQINGAGGAEILTGSIVADTITGGAGDDTIDGGGGSDTAVFSGNFAEYSFADVTTAVRVVDGTAGRDGTDLLSNVEFLRFADQTVAALIGDGNANTLAGTAAAELIFGLAGADMLTGAAGNDVLAGGGGNDTLDGGADVDTAVFTGNRAEYSFTDAATSLQIVDGVGGRDETDTLVGIELLRFADQTVSIVIGTQGDESLAGTNAADAVFGLDGNDTMNGFAGADSLFGGAGSDVFRYGGAEFESGETVDGGSGSDTLVFTGGGGGGINDFSTGSVLDIEALVFEAPISVVSTFRSDQLATTTAVTGGSLAGLESHTLVVNAVSGGTADLSGVVFTSWASGHNVQINGAGGNETLTGGSVADTINGGAGNDQIDGGLGQRHGAVQRQLRRLQLRGFRRGVPGDRHRAGARRGGHADQRRHAGVSRPDLRRRLR